MTHEDKNINSDTEFKAPDWINTDLIQKALRNNADTNLEVENIAVRVATVTGDNYASTIYRVKAELSDGNAISLLVKGPPPGQAMNDATQEWGAFKREELMLTKVIPEMQTLLETAAPGRFEPLAARCLLYGTHPVEFLVLEDLTPAGFKMADRKRGLGLRHSLLALQSLARYHAGSHALLRQKPELADRLSNPLAEGVGDATSTFFEGGVQLAADACKSWPGCEEYATLLEKYKPVVLKTCLKQAAPKPGEFTVILHSDFWVNNMMFRYEEGSPRPQGHRMVDFQCCTVGSPTIDLLYFCNTSVTDDVSAHHQDLLLREYYCTLDETLQLLKLEAPSFDTLMKDLDAHGSYALLGTLNVIPIVKAQRPVDADVSYTDGSSEVNALYEDPAVKKWMQRVLPEYKKRGWLPSTYEQQSAKRQFYE